MDAITTLRLEDCWKSYVFGNKGAKQQRGNGSPAVNKGPVNVFIGLVDYLAIRAATQ